MASFKRFRTSRLLLTALLAFITISLLSPQVFADDAPADEAPAPAPEAEEEEGEPAAKEYYQMHGWLMFVSFGLLFPVGIIISAFGKNTTPLWFYIHVGIQLLATAIATAGFAISINKFEALNPATNHAKIGIALMIAVWLQVIMGALRPKKGASMRSSWWSVHWLLGTGTVIIGWFTIHMGMDLYIEDWGGNLHGLYVGFAVLVSVFGFFYLLAARWPQLLSQSEKDGDSIPNNYLPPGVNGFDHTRLSAAPKSTDLVVPVM